MCRTLCPGYSDRAIKQGKHRPSLRFWVNFILGYFAQDKGDIDAGSIEEFLTSTDTFQLIAIDQKKSVKFTTADDIPEGCSAIIFKKPKGTKIDMTNLAKSLRKELLY